MNGFCDWCEEIATMKRGEDDICEACDARLLAEEASEAEPFKCRGMTFRDEDDAYDYFKQREIDG